MSIWDRIWGEKFLFRPFSPTGFSKLNETGAWRSLKPIRKHPEKCIRCDLCWIFCPEGVIKRPKNGGEDYVINYKYCKGCGICAEECRAGVIEMVSEV